MSTSRQGSDPAPREGQLTAHWGPRRESREACAVHLHETLVGIGRIDPLLERWFELGMSRKQALQHEYVIDVEGVLAALKPDRQFPQLGFSFAAWSGSEPPASIRAGLGRYGDQVINSFNLNLPELTTASENIYDLVALERLMTVVAEALRPDWMVIKSRSAEPLEFNDMQIAPGWKTYIRGARPSLGRIKRLKGATLEFRGDDAWITADSDVWSVPEALPSELRQELVRTLRGSYPWLRTADGARRPSER